MQKKIVFVILMMSCCVVGIIVLQLYWNFKNYQSVVANFKKDANNALDIAVDKEISQRRQQLVEEVKTWMNNPSIVKITCDTNNKEHSTTFTIQDAKPYYADEKADQVTMGISTFTKKLGKINPEAKKTFIDHFAKIVMNDLKGATVHYYTQGIGHRLDKTFNNSKLDSANFTRFYKDELAKRQISTAFVLNKKLSSGNSFVTHKANTAFRRPYVSSLVFASLENPDSYYLRETKWLIIGSFLLIGITLSCFYYTLKTLFNQHKLVAIKNQFINNMTHEINTPLSSIQVTAEALKKFKPNEETTASYLEIILYQTQKLNGLTNEILENAKLDVLNFSLKDKIDLKQLISEILADLYSGTGIQFSFDASDYVIQGNRAHLYRTVTNLLENAVKYNASPTPEISIGLAKVNKGILLRITDNGLGIADEYKLKIFDQFYRIPTGNMHDVKGYGLGLNYVKKVILQHGGSISVTDNKPAGTIFSIKFSL